MATANYLYISTDSFKLENIFQMEIIQNINEHAILKLTALLKEEQKESDIYNTTQDSRIRIYNDLEKEYIFIGIITNIHIENRKEVYYLSITAVSSTFLLDIKKQSRSFQNKDMSYQDIIYKILNNYKGSQVLPCPESKTKIGHLIVQYNETDWEFLKRIASQLNKGLISYCVHDTPAFYFGESIGTYRGELQNNNFSVTKDINKFIKSKKDTLSDILEVDCITFQVEGISYYKIGDYLDYKNIRLYIKSISAKFIAGELIYVYSLCSKNGLKENKKYNERIKGVSIKGKVISITNDLIKVHLSIDANISMPESELWQFPYSTIYTAEGNAGWYCMPEIGDTVLIYFPSEKEEEAIGLNSIRENNNIEKTLDPEIKYFRTANGKELKFSPEEILITAVNDKNDIIYIRLNEENGIEINSSKPIHIISSSDIHIDSQNKLKIQADDEITLKCKTSKITMDSMIDIISKNIRIN